MRPTFHPLGCVLIVGTCFFVDLDLHSSGMLRGNCYEYMKDLLALDSYRPLATANTPEFILDYNSQSPLNQSEWAVLLTDHSFVTYILRGIQEGFCIGFNRQHQLGTSPGKRPSLVPNIITKHLWRELSLGRMIKLPPYICPHNLHTSLIGIIPKKNKPGKWRLIVDLSSPDGGSVNNGISTSLASLSYSSVDHLAALALKVGRGTFLVKADIKEAYRMIKVHLQVCHLLSVKLENSIFIDQALPFGLRSAPKIFSAAADAIQWILLNQGIPNLLHYLDDFILVAKNHSEAIIQKNTLTTAWEKLGVPMEVSKLEGPSQTLKFLGIEVDTVNLQLRPSRR